MATWITGANGNRASVEWWGSEKAARASLATLTRCTNCTNCDLTGQHVRMPVFDPRGYIWLAVVEDGEWIIRAGCRRYTITESRTHWLHDAYAGPEAVKSTVGMALDWLETQPIAEARAAL